MSLLVHETRPTDRPNKQKVVPDKSHLVNDSHMKIETKGEFQLITNTKRNESSRIWNGVEIDRNEFKLG